MDIKLQNLHISAVVRDYMLEKSRVVNRNTGEGIFHIFYALFAGCPEANLNDLFLNEPAETYRYGKGQTITYKSTY